MDLLISALNITQGMVVRGSDFGNISGCRSEIDSMGRIASSSSMNSSSENVSLPGRIAR